MKIAIIGQPQAGQQELFSLLTGIPLETLQQKPLESHLGVCPVRDPRIERLALMYKPKKTTYARIEYLLLPDFKAGGMKNADELCFVCRSESAKSDILSFLSELILSDLILVEKRLENIAKSQKSKHSEQNEKDKRLMEKCKLQLEQEKPLSKMDFNEEETIVLKTCQFLTQKPLIFVFNDPSLNQKILEEFGYPAISVSAELEQEISQLPEAERASFMQEMGIDESALNKMNRAAFAGLGLISFFTVGEDEVRAWPIKKGSLAPQAGGTIHSDIEKGFVRAEMFKYEDLMEHGSEAKLKELGKFSLKGRDYTVEDGDILSFRFNV